MTHILDKACSSSQAQSEATRSSLQSALIEGPTRTTTFCNADEEFCLVVHEDKEYHGVKRHDYNRAILTGSLGVEVGPKEYLAFNALRASIEKQVDAALENLGNHFLNEDRVDSKAWVVFHQESKAIEAAIDEDRTVTGGWKEIAKKHIEDVAYNRLENGAGSFVQSILEAHEEKIQEKFTDINRPYGHMKHDFASLIVMQATRVVVYSLIMGQAAVVNARVGTTQQARLRFNEYLTHIYWTYCASPEGYRKQGSREVCGATWRDALPHEFAVWIDAPTVTSASSLQDVAILITQMQ
ncbi:hypothetical protein FFLO_07090 [Filobasidium floriforme]|uniref:Uncharacterized protein n=1 Tax=Filobasidium floriforme TaxID=5210 RepID=A0A8K0JDK8_9TREE|nr:hypothetical protein FFLO_07090 [Filobasidium floriforme]